MAVVIVSAVHDISVGLATIRNGAYDYLLKPFEREQLLATVRRATENRRLHLENRAYQNKLEAHVKASTAALERSYDITLEALGDALDLKVAETVGHSKRVVAFTIALARAMGLSADKIRVIARGAFLHDNGKLAIPDAILLKPGSLNKDEIAIMREHCYRGYQMLRRIPFLAESAEIVYAHHEFWDGSGYPRGLRGEQIPLGAGMVAVAEVLDVITSDQPYRKAQPFAVARDEMLRWSGRQFDPEVVRVFLSLPESLWQKLKQEIDDQIYRFASSQKAQTKQTSAESLSE